MAEPNPTVVVLAGPNGAGKTTASRTLLAEALKLLTFVNADAIAQGLAAFAPESAAIEAGRIMLARLKELAAQRASFAFETTLSGRYFASWLGELRRAGYQVHLVYFWVESAELAIERVANRVAEGGHHIPEATVRQRYQRSVANLLHLYRSMTTRWSVYDNTQRGNPLLVAFGEGTDQETIVIAETWKRIKEIGEP